MTSAPAPLVDTHCHLNMAVFEDDLEAVLQRAHEAGITKILIPGTDFENSRRAISLASQNPGIYAAIGFHPHDAKNWTANSRSDLEELAGQPQVVAIGEIGLDYHHNHSDPELQRKVFQEQLELARELELPVVIHNREAIHDILPLLKQWSADLPEPLIGRCGVLHAFSADQEVASNAIELGFYIGIAGPITFRKADALRVMVAALPLERLLTETDAPYMTPDPHRGKRNEPSHVQFITAAIANTRQVDVDRAREQTAVNARALFQWNHEITNSYVL